MKMIERLNVYLADLMVGNVKLHNLHWNVVGKEFVQIHLFTEELYDDFFAKFDEVAEALKMRGEYPLASVADYLKNSCVEEIPSKDYSPCDVLEESKKMIEHMRNHAVEIRKIADDEGDFTLVAMMEDHVGGYDKNLWFIKSIMK